MALPPINGTPPQGPGASPASPGRTSAQRAFFDAAMGRAQAVSSTAAASPVPERPQATAQASAPRRAAPAATPLPSFDPKAQPFDPAARPGSIVNVRV